MSNNRARVAGLITVLSLGLGACGAPEAAPSEAPETAGEEPSPLLTGATDVSFNVTTQSTGWESETDAATSASGVLYVGYNAAHDGPETYVNNTVNGVTVEDRIICAGTNHAGYSTRRTNGVWAKSRMPMPAGQAVLVADPALTNVGNAIFYSMLTIPTTRFQQRANFNGCLRFSTLDTNYYSSLAASQAVRGACIGRANVNNGVPGEFLIATCFATDRFLDGGSMAHTANSAYAAYFDTSNGTALVMRGAPLLPFSAIVASPITDVTGHPVLTVVGNVVWMLAPTGGNTLKLAGYSETTNTWSAVTTVATNLSRDDVFMKSTGTQIRSRGYTITTVNAPPAPARINIFYQRKTGNFMRVQGVSCGFGGDLVIGCGLVAKWLTPSTDNAFMPAAAESSRLFPGALFRSFRHYVSYYSDEGRTDGSVRVRFTEVTSTNAFTASFGPGQSQFPCVIPPNYWGDYDVMYSRPSAGINWGTLGRTVTDSTQGACDQRQYRVFHQHVSELAFTPNL